MQPQPTSRQRHLQIQLDEANRAYDSLTKRIEAIDTDLRRTTDGEQRLSLEERRQEKFDEREKVAARIEELQRELAQLAGQAPAPSPAEQQQPAAGEQPAVPAGARPVPAAPASAPPTLNFDLHLSGSLGSVAVEVLDSPGGQTNAPIATACALDPNALANTVVTQPGLQAFGRALWRCAFGPSQVEGLWRASRATAGNEGVLRLRLVVDSPDLAALPWELLYDETLARFLALDRQTPVTRFLRLPFAPLPWPQERPLRLLFTGASPNEQYGKLHIDPLVIAQQWQGIQQGVDPLVKAGRLEASAVLEGATRDGLLAALRRQVDIWHYLGHGQPDGLYFVDARGEVKIAEAGMLGQLLAGEGVRLAVLNTCLAGSGGGQAASVAGALVRAGIPAVVAMQAEIPYDAAQAFASAFYDAIAVGQGVDQAVTSARKAIWAAEDTLWWAPALFMRAPQGRIWQEPERPQATTVNVTGDRNVVITGSVGGNVSIKQ